MRCLALFTGGLDSQIAVRLMQQQGIEVIGVHWGSAFMHLTNPAAVKQAAERLQIELKLELNLELLNMVNRPRFGFAEGLAPCLDCRSHMVSRVRAMLEPLDASFIVSGEVIGQRPGSLRSRDLESIAFHGDAEDLLLRPLSAKLLPPTLPERIGWVDRSQLLDWQGRSRKQQLALAKKEDLEANPEHVAGCLLLDPVFSDKLRRTLAQRDKPLSEELACLRRGRHLWSDFSHLVIAKNGEESEGLHRSFVMLYESPRYSHERQDFALIVPDNFRGPNALLFGPADVPTLQAAAVVIGRYSKLADGGERWLNVTGPTTSKIRVPRQGDAPCTVHFVGLND